MSEPRIRIRLRVAPGARRTHVTGRHGDAWKVQVAAPAERGRANAALTSALAGVLDVPASAVAVVAGRTSRDKLVEVRGRTADEADRLLELASVRDAA